MTIPTDMKLKESFYTRKVMLPPQFIENFSEKIN